MADCTYICLRCGKKVYVTADEYKQKRSRPVCDNCNIAVKKAYPEKAEGDDDFVDVLRLVGRVFDIGTRGVNGNKSSFYDIESVEYWQTRWQSIGCLGDAYDNGELGRFSHCVGLYMHKINGAVMYIGRAVELTNGGLRKRLSDYCRPDGSARKHPSGQKIHENRYRIQTSVLVVGSDIEAVERSKNLEKLFVGRYNPPWNDKLKTER